MDIDLPLIVSNPQFEGMNSNTKVTRKSIGRDSQYSRKMLLIDNNQPLSGRNNLYDEDQANH